MIWENTKVFLHISNKEDGPSSPTRCITSKILEAYVLRTLVPSGVANRIAIVMFYMRRFSFTIAITLAYVYAYFYWLLLVRIQSAAQI